TDLARPAAIRRDRDAGHQRAGLARRVLLAVPAAGAARGRGAGRGDRLDAVGGLAVGADRRGDAAGDPSVRWVDWLAYEGPDQAKLDVAGPTEWSFPGCRAGPGHAQGVRPGEGAGAYHRAGHRGVPGERDGQPA